MLFALFCLLSPVDIRNLTSLPSLLNCVPQLKIFVRRHRPICICSETTPKRGDNCIRPHLPESLRLPIVISWVRHNGQQDIAWQLRIRWVRNKKKNKRLSFYGRCGGNGKKIRIWRKMSTITETASEKKYRNKDTWKYLKDVKSKKGFHRKIDRKR